MMHASRDACALPVALPCTPRHGSPHVSADTPSSGSRRFALTRIWPRITEPDASELLAFWKQHNAIPSEQQARARLAQVVLLARDGQGKIAGVCTAYAMTPPQLGQPMYFWRAFISPECRSTRLIGTLLSESCEVLGERSRDNGFPCIGILLELENDRFGSVGRKAEWINPRFAYIGKSPRGLDVRAHYFRGAKLK